jgi:hypothetical protein
MRKLYPWWPESIHHTKTIWSPGMDMINSALKSSSPAALSLLRLVTAYLFLQHGTAKLFHVPHLPVFDQLHVLSRDGFAGMLGSSCRCSYRGWPRANQAIARWYRQHFRISSGAPTASRRPTSQASPIPWSNRSLPAPVLHWFEAVPRQTAA